MSHGMPPVDWDRIAELRAMVAAREAERDEWKALADGLEHSRKLHNSRREMVLQGVIRERDDARLALEMARGEGWPEGWTAHGDTFVAPNRVDRIQWSYMAHRWRLLRNSEEAGCSDTQHPELYDDALLAHRAYQAMVKA